MQSNDKVFDIFASDLKIFRKIVQTQHCAKKLFQKLHLIALADALFLQRIEQAFAPTLDPVQDIVLRFRK